MLNDTPANQARCNAWSAFLLTVFLSSDTATPQTREDTWIV